MASCKICFWSTGPIRGMNQATSSRGNHIICEEKIGRAISEWYIIIPTVGWVIVPNTEANRAIAHVLADKRVTDAAKHVRVMLGKSAGKKVERWVRLVDARPLRTAEGSSGTAQGSGETTSCSDSESG